MKLNIIFIFWPRKQKKTLFLGLILRFSNLNVLHKGLLMQDWVFRLGSQSLLSNKNGRCSTSFKNEFMSSRFRFIEFSTPNCCQRFNSFCSFEKSWYTSKKQQQSIVCLLILQMLHTNLLQWEIFSANPSLYWKQGFPFVLFLTGKNLFPSPGNPVMKTGFSLCGKSTQGKTCTGPVLALYGIAVYFIKWSYP